MKDFIRQLKENYLAIISLLIAVIALIHNKRLYERSETNRNTRTASFEILMKLGELQQEVNLLVFAPESKGVPINAWGYVALIGDLSKLVPAPVPQKVDQMIQVWKENYAKIKENENSADVISQSIDEAREAVIQVITHLK